jgi:alkanesulfonate monooxygenase SsuD/methylene tetrahydromethanopterin reductase-like flavin-dependent oxidoreductase (luciferase family)
VQRKIEIYREGIANCEEPLGAYVHNEAATFTMALCSSSREAAVELARESFEWYPKTGARQIATLTDWMAERNESLGTYAYAADMKKTDDSGLLDLLSLEYLVDSNACVLGTPAECLEACKAYEAAGVDLLLCLVNPYKIPHESVMETIELMGTEVIPAFAG